MAESAESQFKGLCKLRAIVRLDVGCGPNRQPGWIGMDRRPCKGVDIVHDVQVFPWPIPDSSCDQVLMSHLWEHIEPKYRIDVANEVWRIMKSGGQWLISAPYACSPGAQQDPTHRV
jgi:predicted SAM-dependent methyltransferase